MTKKMIICAIALLFNFNYVVMAVAQDSSNNILVGLPVPTNTGVKLNSYFHTLQNTGKTAMLVNKQASFQSAGIYSGIASGTDFHEGEHIIWGNIPPDPHGIKWLETDISGVMANGTPYPRQVLVHKDLPYNFSSHWLVGFRIDTTQFQSGSTLRIYMTAAYWSPNYQSITTEFDYRVMNQGYINYNSRITNGRQLDWVSGMYNNVKAAAIRMGVKPTVGEPDDNGNSDGITTDTRPIIMADLPFNTFFFIATHGDPYNFCDCQYDPENALASNTVGYKAVAKCLSDKLPSSYECPYPPGSNPPYNFVHMFACEEAGEYYASPSGPYEPPGIPTHEMANSFGMINGFSVDKASLLWHNEMRVDSTVNPEWTNRLFTYLEQGFSLRNAVTDASVDGKPYGEPYHGAKTWAPVKPIIDGDPTMTVHGVWLNKGDQKQGKRGSLFYWCYDGADTDPG